MDTGKRKYRPSETQRTMRQLHALEAGLECLQHPPQPVTGQHLMRLLRQVQVCKYQSAAKCNILWSHVSDKTTGCQSELTHIFQFLGVLEPGTSKNTFEMISIYLHGPGISSSAIPIESKILWKSSHFIMVVNVV
jgi:hypothetical protein